MMPDAIALRGEEAKTHFGHPGAEKLCNQHAAESMMRRAETTLNGPGKDEKVNEVFQNAAAGGLCTGDVQGFVDE